MNSKNETMAKLLPKISDFQITTMTKESPAAIAAPSCSSISLALVTAPLLSPCAAAAVPAPEKGDTGDQEYRCALYALRRVSGAGPDRYVLQVSTRARSSLRRDTGYRKRLTDSRRDGAPRGDRQTGCMHTSGLTILILSGLLPVLPRHQTVPPGADHDDVRKIIPARVPAARDGHRVAVFQISSSRSRRQPLRLMPPPSDSPCPWPRAPCW